MSIHSFVESSEERPGSCERDANDLSDSRTDGLVCWDGTSSEEEGKDLRYVRILTRINKSVTRELHHLPAVEHTLVQLAGA